MRFRKIAGIVSLMVLMFSATITPVSAKEFSKSVTFEKLNYQGTYSWPLNSTLGNPRGMWCWNGTCGYGVEKADSPNDSTPLPIFEVFDAPGVQTTVIMNGKIANKGILSFEISQQHENVSDWMLYRNQNLKNTFRESKISTLSIYVTTQISFKCYSKSKSESNYILLSYQPVGNSGYDDWYWKSRLLDHVRHFDVQELYELYGKRLRDVKFYAEPTQKLDFRIPNSCHYLSMSIEPRLVLAAKSLNPLSYDDPLRSNSRWILIERIARVSLNSVELEKLENYVYNFNVTKHKACPKSKLFCK